MNSVDSVLWKIEPHTKAKHEILKNYLGAWFPILGRTSERLIYLDGFAGPGTYKGGEEGSPVIALRTFLEHDQYDYFKTYMNFLFIEEDVKRAITLREVLGKKFPNLPENCNYLVIDSEYAPAMESLLGILQKEGAKLAPTFAFLDPFGFSGLPMNLNKRLLQYPKCEVLITFMSNFINRFLKNEQILDELFGTPDWRKIHSFSDSKERQDFLIDLYRRQLEKVGGARYTLNFEMINKNNQTLYYLVFGTKHITGLERMKRAMLRVDKAGEFRFSDLRDPKQKYLIEYGLEEMWVPRAADMVYDQFRGRSVLVEDVEEFVLVETPYLFKKKAILKYLETAKPPKILFVIRERGKRIKYTYPAGSTIQFR